MIEVSWQDKIIQEAKIFADTEIRPYADEFELNEGIPRELINKMADKGYLAANFPKEYGGLALDPVYYGIFTEEIGKACCSTRAILTVHSSLVGEVIMRWGTTEQKNYWLPAMAKGVKIGAFALTEPEVGTDAKSIMTAYRKEGNKYVINGEKKWITLGCMADFFIVVASNEGIATTFLVNREAKGVTTYPIRGLLAGKATYIAEIKFDNVEVGEESVLGKEGNGFSYIVSTALDNGRYSIAWAGVAIAQEALNEMVAYSRRRSQFGKKICNFQLIQGMIADAVTKIQAARALCIDAGELRDRNDEDAVIKTTIAKYFTSKIAMEIAIDAVQIHGGNGCCNKYPVERLFREAKVLEIIEGTSQVLQKVISNYGLRRYYKKSKE